MARSPARHMIIVGLVVLVGVTVALVLKLMGRHEDERDNGDAVTEPVKHLRARPTENPPVHDVHAPPSPTKIARATSGSSDTPPARAHRQPEAVDAGPIVNGHRVPLRRYAPPVFPADIKKIKDPKKRMQALRMHRVARMKVRISILQRRKNILDRTLAAARQSGDPQRISQVEKQAQQLDKALGDANKRLDEVKREAGVP